MKRKFHLRRVLWTALTLALAACNTPQSTLNPRGPASGNIASLEWAVLITFCVVSLIMWVLLGWAAVRRRGSLETHAPWNEGGARAGS